MNSKQAIILYAKHWFEETDLINDLKKLWNIEYDSTSDRDVFTLSMMMLKQIIESDSEAFLEFISGIHPDNQWKYIRKKSNCDDHIYRCLCVFLSIISVMDSKELSSIFGPICRPTSDILPIRKDITEENINYIFEDR